MWRTAREKKHRIIQWPVTTITISVLDFWWWVQFWWCPLPNFHYCKLEIVLKYMTRHNIKSVLLSLLDKFWQFNYLLWFCLANIYFVDKYSTMELISNESAMESLSNDFWNRNIPCMGLQTRDSKLYLIDLRSELSVIS